MLSTLAAIIRTEEYSPQLVKYPADTYPPAPNQDVAGHHADHSGDVGDRRRQPQRKSIVNKGVQKLR